MAKCFWDMCDPKKCKHIVGDKCGCAEKKAKPNDKIASMIKQRIKYFSGYADFFLDRANFLQGQYRFSLRGFASKKVPSDLQQLFDEVVKQIDGTLKKKPVEKNLFVPFDIEGLENIYRKKSNDPCDIYKEKKLLEDNSLKINEQILECVKKLAQIQKRYKVKFDELLLAPIALFSLMGDYCKERKILAELQLEFYYLQKTPTCSIQKLKLAYKLKDKNLDEKLGGLKKLKINKNKDENSDRNKINRKSKLKKIKNGSFDEK